MTKRQTDKTNKRQTDIGPGQESAAKGTPNGILTLAEEGRKPRRRNIEEEK